MSVFTKGDLIVWEHGQSIEWSSWNRAELQLEQSWAPLRRCCNQERGGYQPPGFTVCGTGSGWRLGFLVVFWLFLVCSHLAWGGIGQVIRAAWGGREVSLAAAELSPGALRGLGPEDKTVETSTSFIWLGVSSPLRPAKASY